MNTWSRPTGGHGAMNGRTLAFMIDSQYRVMAHCQKLLAAEGLSADDRNRLVRLLNESEEQLRQLTLAAA